MVCLSTNTGQTFLRFLGITEKGWSHGDAWTNTFKNRAKCLWRTEPDHRSNFFSSPPTKLCAITNKTEIMLYVTLNNQSHSPTHIKILATEFCFSSSFHRKFKSYVILWICPQLCFLKHILFCILSNLYYKHFW